MNTVSDSPDYTVLARKSALSQPIYEPGKPIEDVARELGLDPSTIIKVASNENAFGASPAAMEAGRDAIGQCELYPDGGCARVKESLAQKRRVSAEQLIIGNGSNEIIELLGHAFLEPGDEVVMGAPAFIVYKLVTLLFGGTPIEVPLIDHRHDLNALAAAVTDRTKLVFLPSPNNPTGTANSQEEIFQFVRQLPDSVIFVFDEAYAEYLESPPDLRPLIEEGRKVICLRTFSKIYGLAGLRIGYGYSSRSMIQLLNRVRQPFNINAVAQVAAVAALADDAFINHCRVSNDKGRAQLEEAFIKMRLEFIPSAANFVMVKVGDGNAVFQELQKEGIIVRPMAPYGMGEWVRVTVGSPGQNERLLTELKKKVRK
ncbi:MAG: histidinol-phosphate transaminase [Opitutaceae bacterium]|nr:histidinol-phosphate transaminase [Opitutaceae bacterium]